MAIFWCDYFVKMLLAKVLCHGQIARAAQHPFSFPEDASTRRDNSIDTKENSNKSIAEE
jgi:hypothetical protein